MTWISSIESAATPFEGLLGQRPELLERYRAFYVSLWRTGMVPRRLLELCRLRIAAIHDCAAEWRLRDADVAITEAEEHALQRGDATAFDAIEQAALAIAELMPFQPHAITDDQIALVAKTLEPKGTVTLLTALAFFDVTCRFKLVFKLPLLDAELTEPPLSGGALI